jgi:ADP-ribose pyrophosphatase YjhB (NUDIX family)
MPHYYVEKDGRVFLVRKSGRLTFPDSRKEIPFRIRIKRKMPLPDDIYFCEPVMDGFPEEWPLKDDVMLMDGVDELVKRAINKSYLRHAVQAIIPKGGKVLMVKAGRGLTKGFWNLPGGFVTYGESPGQSAVREIKEETGLDVKAEKLSGIYTHIFRKSGYYMIAFTYICRVVKGKLEVNEEIKEIAYLSIDDAIRMTKNIFCKWALEDFRKIWMFR